MLSDTQIWDLAERMNVPLVFCNFKDKLTRKKLQYNKSYIINMEDEFDADGEKNDGSHYTAFQVNKYPNGKVEGCYFDSFGQPPPLIIEEFVGTKLPYNTKDIQSLMNSACGWYCLAWLHYINSYEHRTKDLYSDCEHFTDLFDDLNKEQNHLKNEYILKHFFRSKDPSLRKPVEIDGMGAPDPETISSHNDSNKRGV
jgi:hypothetical protein